MGAGTMNSFVSPVLRTSLQTSDPTHTIGIRARWLKETDRRFRELKRSITETIKKNDALRLKERNEGEVGRQGRGAQGLLGAIQTALQAAEAFVFTRDDQAINAMMTWLEEEEKNNILEIVQRPDPITGGFGEPWTNTYVRSSYSKGLAQANAELAKAGADIAAQTVQAAFNQPFHVDRLRLVYTRVFTELEGITATMNAAIRRELTTGMLEGIGPTEMAKRINDRVDKIGITRAKLIARTETVLAHSQASLGEFQRASTVIGEEILVKWITAGGNVRPKHVKRSGKIFTQAGYASRIGEPNCLVGDSMAFSPSNLERVFKRGYKGPIIHIETAKGDKLSCSPNHPILTMSGFVPAKELSLGGNILCCLMSDVANSIGANKNDVVSSLEDKADSLALSGEISSGPTRPLDFHGDGTDGEIATIFTHRGLESNIGKAQKPKTICKKLFSWIYFRTKGFAFSSANKIIVGALHASDSIMSRLCLMVPLGFSHAPPLHPLGFALVSGFNAMPQENLVDCASTIPPSKSFRNSIDGIPGIEKLKGHMFESHVKTIRRTNDFRGHIYNLQTEEGSYIAQNIIVGNCRCSGTPYIQSIEGKPERVNAVP
jgi:hypothetical protein